jgi:hypothetical protein
VEERVEWRSYFPSGRECRLLELTGLDIPREDRFVAVECANTAADGHGDFTNELGRMVELENAAGEAIPTTPGLRSVSDRIDRLSEMVCRTTPYLDHPDVREALETSLPDDLYTFETHGVDATRPHTLDDPDEGQATGTVAVMRGKPEYLLGNLSPAYEAVRDHWLDLVEEFIAAGVDGVNVRLANHTRSHEHYEYGYNEPVCDRAGDLDHAAVARRNGEAYTAFLREAAELLDANGCEIGVHLSNEIFADDGRPHGFRGTQGVMHIPRNVEWQWRTWIGEFADYVELRGFGNNRRWRRDRMVDRIAAAIAESDRSPPLVYQSERTFDVDAVGSDPAGPFEELRAEVEYATDHPAIDAWNLYETRDVTRLSGDGSLVGSRQYADFLSEYFDPSA